MEKRFSPYIQPGAMLGLTLIFPRGSFFDISLRIAQDPLYKKRFSPHIQPGAMLGLTLIFLRGSFFDISLRIVQDPLYGKTVLSVYPARRDAWAYFDIPSRIVKRLFFRST